ncbi:MAG: hypothetical protein COT38_00400 [Candidatus Omnitrophica bacterium CG08_land_8_20_14_0_20_41_16]|uniref:DNA polymerase III subunit delta' n=1 Tax=Candidatus Sherwoodlollariibacterium unditelluris TaxID=1974757 RepID=A0A2G9YJ59_9BACT|nr:MAG: hypothetical protein COX41_03740 [Candidatus Omnitrophica bacterium CG23_combo_of_CG06-09_8_20_14_all_41_10]PIS34402.1 MAG: hypothetical protein COT38_00400 [Candidatus Omnitrophica bacterium CG08_land_8_20_14_0_20_41_16]
MPFSDIRGQDRPVEIIKAYIKNGRLEGGYLFTGPAAIGKKMTAKILSQALNCIGNNNEACGLCPSCLKIERNNHPDVHIISNDESQVNPVRNTMQGNVNKMVSNGVKIDAIRRLQKEISLKAYEGRFKVFIIDNAHTLTSEASNCLLKVLEEPPRGSLIILVTDKPNLLFKTITSRCKVLKFRAIKREELEAVLKKDYGLDNGFAHFLAYFSEGRLGEALKLKDTDILNFKNSIIDKFAVPSTLNIEGIKVEDRRDVRLSLNILSAWFRDLYFMKSGMPDLELINYDRRPDLLKTVNRFSHAQLYRIVNVISNTMSYLEHNINTRLLLYNLKAELWAK